MTLVSPLVLAVLHSVLLVLIVFAPSVLFYEWLRSRRHSAEVAASSGELECYLCGMRYDESEVQSQFANPDSSNYRKHSRFFCSVECQNTRRRQWPSAAEFDKFLIDSCRPPPISMRAACALAEARAIKVVRDNFTDEEANRIIRKAFTNNRSHW